jgi:hypothetical protein
VNSRILFSSGVTLLALSLMASSVHAGPVRLADRELDAVTAGSVGNSIPQVVTAVEQAETKLAALNTRLARLLHSGESTTDRLSAKAQALIQALLLRKAVLQQRLAKLNRSADVNSTTVTAWGAVANGQVKRTVRVEGNGDQGIATATAFTANGKGVVNVQASVGSGRSVASSRSGSVQ